MDRINVLSDEIICHILSFLPTKHSALTSVLSKRWRNLFAFRPNLHLDDDLQEVGCGQSFIDFVDRVLAVSGKLLSACPLLEELTISGDCWQLQKCSRIVSSPTLKKLTIMCTNRFNFWGMTFDTPNLAYLEYSDLVPRNYPFVNLESLVEAKLDLHLAFGSNPTNLIKGLRNVEVLELSSFKTSEIFCVREAIPVFNNLFRLSITTDLSFNDWHYFQILLNKSPNLHTLVIKGPAQANKYVREYELPCPVKVLKITQYGGAIEELEQMKYFLEKLTCLELSKCALAQ